MIIENSGLNGLTSELGYLDEAAEKAGFVRWQWEYYRATYDLKISDKETDADYYVRVSTRAIEGKLENPHAVLNIEDVYIGRATFPHGLDYESPIPKNVLTIADKGLSQLKASLS
ncbi:YugN-like family protein [Paenibacillus endoradicis]|uniref:YugN-like family protein n=1 Tax=Candidatus Pristimantibacillus lignocellulolyticus TaxID=2994561 RepID=A0A9J6ZBE4_9BACL|nr:YugN-like family protein [Paenibacillus endoradicis]MCR8656095.1 YugN-like family protein [Paenibacillus endoradicis]MCR8658421.1 YugN-like family protein [Paenibacillus endoradicis]URN93256.1 MAG: YugN-like family protein [Candidatus Pristimantibacillus lignocellulolyticus]